MAKLAKYYTLYDCVNYDDIYDALNKLQDSEKIEYEMLENSSYDAFRIKDISLTDGELKSLLTLFSKNDVAEYEYASEDLSSYDEYNEDNDDELDSWDSGDEWSEADYDDEV
jgi:hypothetical protein